MFDDGNADDGHADGARVCVAIRVYMSRVFVCVARACPCLLVCSLASGEALTTRPRNTHGVASGARICVQVVLKDIIMRFNEFTSCFQVNVRSFGRFVAGGGRETAVAAAFACPQFA